MARETLSVTEFKARCTEELRGVEEEGVGLEIMRHGKVIALVRRPKTGKKLKMSDVLGSGMGVEYSADHDPDAPAAPPEDWEAWSK